MHLRQASFAGGEVSPQLQGRSDVAKYATALARCRNMLPLRYGSLTTRPGTSFIANATAGRLIPFVLSSSASFVLNFYVSSGVKLNIYKNGALVAGPITTSYAVGDLATLKYAQCGKTLTLCHKSYVPLELKYVSDSSWTLTEVSFDAPAYKFWDATTTGVPKIEMSSGVVRPWSATEFYDTSDPYYVFVRDGGSIYYSVFDNYNKQPSTHCAGVLGVDKFWAIATFETKRWQWFVTTLFRDATNRVFESAAFTVAKCRIFGRGLWDPAVTYAVGDKVSVNEWSGAYYQSLQNGNTAKNPYLEPAWWSGPFAELESGRRHIYGERAIPDEIVLNEDIPTLISWKSQTQTPVANEPRVIGWRVYRGEYGQGDMAIGWVGDTAIEQFTDIGNSPDYTRQPPQGRNPFVVYDGTGAVVATERPATVAYFEQRRVFGGAHSVSTNSRPAWIFGSNVGDYDNFDASVRYQTANQEYEFELASQRYEEIRSLLPVSKLLAFTSGSEWAIGGSQGPLAFDNVDAKVQGSHGSTWLDPLQVGNEALFVQERGPHVQSLVFDFSTQSWDGDELNVFADHLLDGYTIVAWCWAHQPYHAVFMARSDGILLSLTFHREQKVVAWAWHDTQGEVLDVCSVPESNGDSVYMLVRRFGTIMIEKMKAPTDSQPWTTGDYLDSARTAGVGTSPTFTVFANQDVTVIQGGVASTKHVNGSGVIQGVTTPLASNIVVGLPFTQQGVMLAPALEKAETKTLFATVTRFTLEAIALGSIQVGQDLDHLQTAPTRVAGSTPSQVLLEVRPPNRYVKWPTALGCWQQSGPYPLTIVSAVREIEFQGS